MEPNLNVFDESENTRPTLLKVLCILTFIGSSWLILTNIWAYTTAAEAAQKILTIRNSVQNNSTKNTGLNIDSLKTKKTDSSKTNVEHKQGLFFRERMMSSFSKMMTAENIRKTALGAILSALFTLIGGILM